ncbi:hypothetical protein, conserved [Leishmania lindenbergi]|uniref:Transcription like protein nupm1 n=1 Tax=Leishmania lindenbergi TaxID=651832 RepID=A0AAW3A4H4_9TRYP
MDLSVTVSFIFIVSATVLGFAAMIALFVSMPFSCCKISNGDLADGNRGRQRAGDATGQLGSSSSGEGAASEREWRGIPLNSRPPRLTPEQEILRDKAMERYKRRKARQERRCQRQAAREARMANMREGYGEDAASEGEFADGSSVTSRTTLASAAPTARTASTVAYGRGSYFLPSPCACEVHIEEHDDSDDRRSSRSSGSRGSTGTARSRASQGTATTKSHMRHRQRQRLRRREQQQQVDLFNQWARMQMVPSSELSPSSKSLSASSQRDEEGSTTDEGGRRRTKAVFGSRCRVHTHRRRSASVASSAPRPPEDVLGTGCSTYPFVMNAEHGHLESLRVGNQHPVSDKITVDADGSECDTMPFCLFTHSNGATDSSSPHVSTADHLRYANRTGEQSGHLQQRRHKHTWKNVEHNVALSGFFHSPTNDNMTGADIQSRSHYNDGEPSHNPLGDHEHIFQK